MIHTVMICKLFITFLFLPEAMCQQYVTVSTSEGQLRGQVFNFQGWYPEGVLHDMNITQYVGVPFAKPPINELRWQPPVAPDSWTGVRDALDFNTICWQRPIEVYNGLPVQMSEDCLYLNIWVPGTNTDPTNLNLPVMFYIHGGAFQWGTGINPVQFGGYMASDNDVIVVGINYRVNAMGFLSTEDSTAPGNYGIMDMIQALAWVKANIRNFGGNPDSITIFGQSAGGSAVTYLMLSPPARGLFQRAISISGGPTPHWAMAKNYLRELTPLLAIELNCPPDNSQAMMTCMRTKPASEITNRTIALNLNILQTRNDTQGVFAPRIDGVYIPDDPLAIVEREEFVPVDYMTGITSHESWPYRQDWYIPIPGGGKQLENGMNSTDFDILTQWYLRFLDYPEQREKVAQAVKLMYDLYESPGDSIERTMSYTNFLSDFQFNAHNDRFAKLYSKHAPSNAVYNYYFSAFVSLDQRIIYEPQLPIWVRATHADDIATVFGKAKYTMDDEVTLDERVLSNAVMVAYSNFAKAGNPGSIGTVSWPRFTEANPAYMELTTPVEHTRIINPFFPKRMAFWSEFVWPMLDQPSPSCVKD
ncbi:unnamed protein product, partial [Owenia fusiformis]